MKIEIQEAYLIKKNIYSVHAYFTLWDMDVRNIFAKKIKNSWYILLPFSKFTDPETGKKKKFPIIDFINQNTKKTILEEIKKQLNIFFKKRDSNE